MHGRWAGLGRRTKRPLISGGHKSRGQSFVEFALVLPVLMLVLLITIDFGRVFLGWVTLNNAARIAANYAASGQPPLTLAQTAQYQLIVGRETNGINCDGMQTPPPTYPGSNGMTVGGRAVASLSCTFHFITPFLGTLFPGGALPVSASSDFPIRSGVLANIAGQTAPPTVPPNQDFTITPPTGPTPLTVNFGLLTQLGGPAQTWSWNFGDSTDCTLTDDCIKPNPSPHTYSTATTYTVTLTETNQAGSTTHTHQLIVSVSNPAPVADFYGTVPQPPCVTSAAPNAEQCGGSSGAAIFYTWPATVAFTNTSQNTSGATYAWTFGDGATDNTSAPTHIYTVPGVYSVSLTVTSAAGTNTATKVAYVNAGCIVPVFAGVNTANAGNLWTSAHFDTNDLQYYQGASANPLYKKQLPSSAYPIGQQDAQGGLFLTATVNGPNYSCKPVGGTEYVAPTGVTPP